MNSLPRSLSHYYEKSQILVGQFLLHSSSLLARHQNIFSPRPPPPSSISCCRRAWFIPLIEKSEVEASGDECGKTLSVTTTEDTKKETTATNVMSPKADFLI